MEFARYMCGCGWCQFGEVLVVVWGCLLDIVEGEVDVSRFGVL